MATYPRVRLTARDRLGFGILMMRHTLNSQILTHTDWDGQVLRTAVTIAGAGWPAR